LLGGYAHPEISMHTPSLAEYVRFLEHDDWAGVGALMLASAKVLERAGADFLICPDNTIHQALPYIEAESPLPWLHIADAVTDDAAQRGFVRPGLTGTRWLVNSTVYPNDYVRPSLADRDELNRIIMDELVHGVFKPESVASLQNVINHLRDDGCDSVVLGCTELSLVIDKGNSPLPVLDTTRLLARAALRQAV
jgi:aspartate racemase